MAYFSSGEDFVSSILVSDDATAPFVEVASSPAMRVCRVFKLGEMSVLSFEIELVAASADDDRPADAAAFVVDTPLARNARGHAVLSRTGADAPSMRGGASAAVPVRLESAAGGARCALRVETLSHALARAGDVVRGSIRFRNVAR